MNIFYLDPDPQRCAEMMHDKHVVKMILETAQILSTVCHRHGTWCEGMYRPTHANHPSTRWAGDSATNFYWLVEHGQHLCDEYRYRYDRWHKSMRVIELCAAEAPRFTYLHWTEPAQAMPDEFKIPGDAVAAYRAYYLGRKVEQSKWTRRPVPTFVLEGNYTMAKKPKKEQPVADAAPVEKKPRASGGLRGLKGVPLDAIITLLVDHNPKRAGCAAEKRFALYRSGMTQQEFLEFGGTTPDLAYDTAHGYISVEGYEPKAVVKKERAPKAEKPAKAEKAPRGKKAKKAEAETRPAVEDEVVAETIV